MKKIIVLLTVLVMTTAMFAGCAKKEEVTTETTTETATTETATTETATEEAVDVVTTASIVDNVDALINALSANGTWIAAALNDMSTDKEIVVEGAFTNKDLPARKLALYTQDDNRNITASFTLTAPKLIVKSENFRIHGGTFVGDVYVEANGFELSKTAKVTGNVYFASQEYMDSAIFDESSSVSGVKEVK